MLRLAVLLLCTTRLVGSAYGDPVLRVDAPGDCPSQEMLRKHVTAEVSFSQESARWSLEIRQRRSRATLRMTDAETGSELVREVRSKDCEAIAKAFAVIIHGYFVKLQVLQLPVAEPIQEPPPVPEAVKEPAPVAVVAPKVSVGRRESILWAAGGVGVLSNDLDGVAPSAILGFGWIASMGLGLSLSVAGEMRSEQQFEDEIVERVAGRAALSGTYSREVGSFGLRFAIGAGLGVARVSPRNLPGSNTPTRVHPFVLGGLTLHRPMSPNWALLLSVETDMYLVSDQYLIEPYGVVAESPRTSLMGVLGIEWNSGAKK